MSTTTSSYMVGVEDRLDEQSHLKKRALKKLMYYEKYLLYINKELKMLKTFNESVCTRVAMHTESAATGKPSTSMEATLSTPHVRFWERVSSCIRDDRKCTHLG